jgi:stage V sporulation protein AE
MIYLNSFLFAGVVCLICQIVLDNSKLTPGHITSGLTVIGAILSYAGIYDKIIRWCGAGATTLISNFGHTLYSAGLQGYESSGFLGILTGLLSSCGVAIVSVIVFSFIFTIVFKSKD